MSAYEAKVDMTSAGPATPKNLLRRFEESQTMFEDDLAATQSPVGSWRPLLRRGIVYSVFIRALHYANFRNCPCSGRAIFFPRMNSFELMQRLPRGAIPICHASLMAVVRTTPSVGSFPELRTYRYAKCGHVETLEDS